VNNTRKEPMVSSTLTLASCLPICAELKYGYHAAWVLTGREIGN
jgi:hypothetical protein